MSSSDQDSAASHVEPARTLYLDGWRGCAILAVLLGHCIGIPGLNTARFGVEVFFVLSGRLMAEILFVRRLELLTFFRRRASRIYPALIVFSTVMLLVSQMTRLLDISPAQYLGGITLTYNYALPWIGRTGVFDHIWSLCVEEHIYILLGALALIYRRRPFKAWLVIGAIALIFMANGVIQTLLGGSYYEVYWRSDVRGGSILISAATYLYLRERQPAWLRWTYAAPLLVIGALALSAAIVPDPIKYTVASTMLALAVAVLGNSPAWTIRVLENRALLWVGVCSYSIYLWQQPFYDLGDGRLAKLMLLPLALACAVVSFYAVEGPARRFLNRLGAERSTKPVAADVGTR